MGVKYTSYASEILAEMAQAKTRALEIIGGTAEGYAKQKCPVREGRLRGSITHTRISEDTESIGTDVEYAAPVELGHNQQPGRYVPAIGKRLVASHVAARPFLKPALDDHVEEYVRIAKTEYGID